ncbi:MAG: bile acid:sodium symporter family protein [Planctomycetota bacterium]|jgi:sodium/bile acid cotransporter 7
MINFIKKQWLMFGILAALLLAFAAPETGVSLNPNGISASIAIILTFLISGLSLPTEKMIEGVKQYKIHLVVQFIIFVITPAYFYFSSKLVTDYIPENLRIGIYALGILPTTISSCIIFTQITGGNIAVTIFNAVTANFAGIIISPLLLTLMLQGGSASMAEDDIMKIIISLGYKVLLPFGVGQVLHKKLSKFVENNKANLSVASTMLILLIIYFAFCKAVLNPSLKGIVPKLPVGMAYIAVSHLLLVLFIFLTVKLFKYSAEDRISVVYASSQKTLALGVPLITAFFADKPDILGTALVPILFYHPWQIIIASLVIFPILKKKEPEAEKVAAEIN